MHRFCSLKRGLNSLRSVRRVPCRKLGATRSVEQVSLLGYSDAVSLKVIKNWGLSMVYA